MGALFKPYMDLRHSSTYHQDSFAVTLVPLPLILPRSRQTLSGGLMETSRLGVGMPFARSRDSISQNGNPFRKAPETSQLSRLRPKIVERAITSLVESLVAVLARVVSYLACASKKPRAHNLLFMILDPSAKRFHLRTQIASMGGCVISLYLRLRQTP